MKAKRATLLLDFGSDQQAHDLMAQIDEYRKLCGWNRKYFYLTGAAMVIGNNKDNPDLVLAIAEFLAGKK